MGSNVCVLSGVSIGRGAIIGAGSIVTKDVPPYSIACGVPAKPIKMRFDKSLIDRIEASQWWLKGPEELAQYKDIFLEDTITPDDLDVLNDS